MNHNLLSNCEFHCEKWSYLRYFYSLYVHPREKSQKALDYWSVHPSSHTFYPRRSYGELDSKQRSSISSGAGVKAAQTLFRRLAPMAYHYTIRPQTKLSSWLIIKFVLLVGKSSTEMAFELVGVGVSWTKIRWIPSLTSGWGSLNLHFTQKKIGYFCLIRLNISNLWEGYASVRGSWQT